MVKQSTKKLLPLAGMEKIMKKAGANRVADDAKKALKEVLEEYARKVSENAVKLAEHASRRTVKKEDIELAAKTVKEQSF